MRCIAFCASVGVFVRLVCFPSVVACFWGIVCRLACASCRFAFPLARYFRRCALFSLSRGLLVGSGCLKRIRAKFKPLAVALVFFSPLARPRSAFALVDALGRCARAVRRDLPLVKGTPSPMRARAWGRGVTRYFSYQI